jgi:hypothetical protein
MIRLTTAECAEAVSTSGFVELFADARKESRFGSSLGVNAPGVQK